MIVVDADAVTGAYVQPLGFWKVSVAPLVSVSPPRNRRVGRAVYSITFGPEPEFTAPTCQVSVVVPLAFATTVFGFGPAPRSRALL